MNPEEMFVAFRDAYVAAEKAKAIAAQDERREAFHANAEMEEMRAWDEYALEALKKVDSAVVEHQDPAITAGGCAAFADALLKHRRATFLVGDVLVGDDE